MSPREAQVLVHLLEGSQIPEIGERLFITSSTVQDHIKSLLHKTGSKNRSHMIAQVLGWGASEDGEAAPPKRRGVTDQTTAPTDETRAAPRRVVPLGRTLVWLSIASASAALTFLVLRVTLRPRPPGDETTDRIQALIHEANQLIKTLDEKKTT